MIGDKWTTEQKERHCSIYLFGKTIHVYNQIYFSLKYANNNTTIKRGKAENIWIMLNCMHSVKWTIHYAHLSKLFNWTSMFVKCASPQFCFKTNECTK